MDYKEYVIPKKNGKTRKIVAPDEELKAYQRGWLMELEKIFHIECRKHGIAGLDMFHGFLHGKNCITAAHKHIGYSCSLMMDISNFFDSVFINHIHPDYNLDPMLFHRDGYAAQGFPSSPMVANIAAVQVMAMIYSELKAALPYTGFAITIYADDVTVSLTDDDYTHVVQRIVTRAFNDHSFVINERKTRIKYAKYGWRRILGVNVGEHGVRATRKTMRKIRAAKHQAQNEKRAARSAGGLVTWSKCILPKKARKQYSGVLVFTP